ncbi:MAG: STAS domain-containing protein [SAR324 cluster bacterium]|nr:STAS domain-containing protein [SAR324 cluster bacterium]
MELSHRIENNICIISVKGEIDSRETLEFKSYISSLMNEPDQKGIVLNCEKMPYIDSSGIGVFISLLQEAKKKDIGFVMCGFDDTVKVLFEAMGLDRIMNNYPTEEEAIESFNPTEETEEEENE